MPLLPIQSSQLQSNKTRTPAPATEQAQASKAPQRETRPPAKSRDQILTPLAQAGRQAFYIGIGMQESQNSNTPPPQQTPVEIPPELQEPNIAGQGRKPITQDPNPEIGVAIVKGDTEALKKLLESYPDINNYRTPYGDTALTLAVKKGTPEMVEFLINAGAQVNLKEDYYDSFPLIFADQQSTQLLLNAGAEVNVQTKYGDTALHRSTEDQNKRRLLLQAGADPNIPDKSGIRTEYPLHQAAYVAIDSDVAELLEHGANPLVKDSQGKNIFDYLDPETYTKQDKHGQLGVLRALIRQRVDLNSVKNSKGQPFVESLLHEDGTDLLAEVLKSGIDPNRKDRDGSPLLMKTDQVSVVETLLEAGANPNVTDAKGNNPLIQAAAAGNEAVCNALLLKGANPEFKNQEGETPLLAAARNGKAYALVEKLVSFGVNPNVQDKNGETSLMLAIRNGNIAEVAALLNPKNPLPLDLTLKNKKGETAEDLARSLKRSTILKLIETRMAKTSEDKTTEPTPIVTPPGSTKRIETPALFEAILQNKTKEALMMIQKLPDVNAPRNPEGDTLLMLAAATDNTEILQALLQKGAKPNESDKTTGTTALTAAARNNAQNAVSLLLEKGAKIGVQENDGTTVLHAAVESGNPSMVKLLIQKGAPVNTLDQDGITPLDQAILDERTTAKGEKHHEAIVNILLSDGADPNLTGDKNHSPLHTAVNNNNIAMVKALTQAGGRFSNEDEKTGIVLDIVYHRKKYACLRELVLSQALSTHRKDLIQGTANRGDLGGVELLTNPPLKGIAPANVNVTKKDLVTDKQQTALDQAMFYKHEGVIDALIVAGADLEFKNPDNAHETPLFKALRQGNNIRIVEKLLSAGAKVNVQNDNGDTPLIIAVRNGDLLGAKALLTYGADKTLKNKEGKDGKTALDIAKEKHFTPLVELLGGD